MWLDNNRNEDAISNWIFEQLNSKTMSVDTKGSVKKKVSNFTRFIQKNLPKCNRTVSNFKVKHSNWLSLNMTIILDSKKDVAPGHNKMGRPPLTYEAAGPRLKRKLATELADTQENDTSLLMHAATVSARKSNEKDTAFVLKNCLVTPSGSSGIKKNCFCRNLYL